MFSRNHPPHADMTPDGAFSVAQGVTGLIAVLAAIHFVRWVGGPPFYDWTLEAFAYFSPWTLGPDEALLPGQEVWGMLSYAFIHADWVHLMMNCVWLLIFGTLLERRMGAGRMLAIAAFSAVCGCLAGLLIRYGDPFVLVGASGGIAGLLAACAPVMFGVATIRQDGNPVALHDKMALAPNGLLRSRGVLVFAGSYILIAALNAIGITGMQGTSGPIAWDAHLGGFAGGLVAFYLLDNGPRVPGSGTRRNKFIPSE